MLKKIHTMGSGRVDGIPLNIVWVEVLDVWAEVHTVIKATVIRVRESFIFDNSSGRDWRMAMWYKDMISGRLLYRRRLAFILAVDRSPAQEKSTIPHHNQ